MIRITQIDLVLPILKTYSLHLKSRVIEFTNSYILYTIFPLYKSSSRVVGGSIFTHRALTSKQAEEDQPNLDIYYQMDEYIKSKQGRASKETIGVFGQVKEHLLAFEIYRKKPIPFECIDLNFHEQLVHFLIYEYEQKATFQNHLNR